MVSLNAPPMTCPLRSTMARDWARASSLTRTAERGLVGSVNTRRRMNQYKNVSAFHGPNGSLPKGSEWRASMSPAGGYLGGLRWRDCGSRWANEAATTRAIC